MAVKDCSYDLLGATKVMARTSLAYYSGCEELNLPLYALGGAGYVSTVANAAPRRMRAVLDAFDAGDTAEAARLNGLTIRSGRGDDGLRPAGHGHGEGAAGRGPGPRTAAARRPRGDDGLRAAHEELTAQHPAHRKE